MLRRFAVSALGLVLLGPACLADSELGSLEGPPSTPDAPRDTTPPILERLPLDTEGTYDPVTQRLGDLSCSPVSDRPLDANIGCFQVFGAEGAELAGYLTFVSRERARVKAVSAGVVHSISFLVHDHLTHSDTFRIVIRPRPDSAFAIEYRHVKEVEVRPGDAIDPGQVLGRAGDYFDLDHGMVMLSIIRSQQFRQYLCPERFLSVEGAEAFGRVQAAHAEAWPQHAGGTLCRAESLFCDVEGCADRPPGVAFGDLEAGRSIYRSGCASCHGTDGRGGVGPPLRPNADPVCQTCDAHQVLSDRTALDMPPEGRCVDRCADDVAAYIRVGFGWR